MDKNKVWIGLVVFALAVSASGREKPKYEVNKMPKALYLEAPEAKDGIREFSIAGCPELKPGSNTTYGYLEMIVSAGNRRSGSREMLCAAEAVRKSFEAMGYKTELVSYRFPYYALGQDSFAVKTDDGRGFASHPMMYSASTESAPGGEVSGKVVRPLGLKKGDIVFVKGGTSDLPLKAVKWRDKGAIGLVVGSKFPPFNMTGLPTPHHLSSSSWHYAALPGMVVQDGRKLLGKQVVIRNSSRIYAGKGYNVVAFTPGNFDNYILVGGHLDSCYTGALDDGSGVAVALRIAELLKDEKPGKTGLIFAGFDGEELGLFGSRVFAERFGTKKIKAMLNLDMVSVKNNFLYSKPDKAKIMPKVISAGAEILPLARKNFKSIKAVKIFPTLEGFSKVFGGGLPTDLEWYWTAGVPGVFIYTPDKYYHTERDNMDWMDAGDLESLSEAGANMVKDLESASFVRPKHDPEIDLEFHRQDDGSIVFDVRVQKGGDNNPRMRKKPVVLCFYEHGLEKKVELKQGHGSGYRGMFAPLYKGEYTFVASAVVDKTHRAVVKSLMVSDPMKEEPKEPEKKKGGKGD